VSHRAESCLTIRRFLTLWRPGPLDYRQGHPSPRPDRPPAAVDIIVPVFGALEELRACIDSLSSTTDLAYHRLALVVDGPQSDDMEYFLSTLPSAEIVVLRNRQRRGFVASVNRGMAQSARDVLLLNSDTIVTTGWLEKLQAAAYSGPSVATATPFSNNATICSLPQPAEINTLPSGHDVQSFALLVETASAREYPRLPTGVGVCLYIKRKILDLIGPFDEGAFGLGYGEENDFCFRALKSGYLHVLDDATFVYHRGQSSFGASRTPRVARAHRRIRRLHPAYLPTVAAFLQHDPLAPARQRVVRRLRHTPDSMPGRGLQRVLHLVHGWPPYNHAGTELYCYWLAHQQKPSREVAVYSRIADPTLSLGDAIELHDDGIRVRLAVNNFTQRDPLSRNALRCRTLERDFARFIDQFRPDLLHVHHLAGHAISLARIARLPTVFQVQDWWPLCARANLLDHQRRLCSGPTLARCARCLPLTALPPSRLWTASLYAYRRWLVRRTLRVADAFVMGSRFIEESYRRFGLIRSQDRIHVLSYGVPSLETPPRSPAALPLRFGYIGSIMPHKGVHVAVEAFREIDPGGATLEIWGDPGIAPAYAAELRARAIHDGVLFRGTFAEADKGTVLARLDALIIPSLGLESYGLVAREALSVGVPVIVSARGALPELLDPAPSNEEMGVWPSFEAGNSQQLAALVRQLIAAPHILTRWWRTFGSVKSVHDHACEIDQIYAAVGAHPAEPDSPSAPGSD
jgi:GT2 family glycosyltransferase/glycosyltransferase involved in cell wall biosynthesis